MIDDLLEDLKRDEGWVPHAYQDSEGYWTIGYGFLIDERRGGYLPLSIGEIWLEQAAMRRWNELARKEPWLLEQPEAVQRAVANMAYQMGVEGVRDFEQMLRALRAGSRRLAAKHALDSRWAKQTPERALRVATLMENGT